MAEEETLLTGRQQRIIDNAKKRWKKRGLSDKEIEKRVSLLRKQLSAGKTPGTAGGYIRPKAEVEASLEAASETGGAKK